MCCVTVSQLPNLSEPLFHLESGAGNRDSAHFSGLSIKEDLSIHPSVHPTHSLYLLGPVLG